MAKRNFADVIKDFEMGGGSWVIQVGSPNHMNPEKWRTFPSCGQREGCDNERKVREMAE